MRATSSSARRMPTSGAARSGSSARRSRSTRRGTSRNHITDRDRKLLLKRSEIDALEAKVKEKGLTLVPTKLYFKNGQVKIEVALGRGKDKGDKRRTIADRDAKRQIERALKARR